MARSRRRPSASSSQPASGDAEPSSKSRSIPLKCQKCAMLSAGQAQNLHGPEGDGCWNPAVCYSRRSYARHRDRRNQIRSRKQKAAQSNLINVEFPPLQTVTFAVLVVYRKAGVDTPIHAIGAEVWQGQEKVAMVAPVHCAGLVPSQVHAYVSKMLSVLEERYKIKKFASQVRLDPELCSIRPCPLSL